MLKTGLYIDNCFGKGYVKNVQWNPSFWGWSKYDHGPGGKDGSLTCTIDAEGAGSCTGSFEHEWGTEDAKRVRGEDIFASYDG